MEGAGSIIHRATSCWGSAMTRVGDWRVGTHAAVEPLVGRQVDRATPCACMACKRSGLKPPILHSQVAIWQTLINRNLLSYFDLLLYFVTNRQQFRRLTAIDSRHTSLGLKMKEASGSSLYVACGSRSHRNFGKFANLFMSNLSVVF